MSPAQFGRRLREQREHHRITLEAIASSTKIKASLLAALERGDIAAWPTGIFQRAFVREYARAIGLPPEPVLAEFLRVFAGESAGADGDPPPDGELRLTLAAEPFCVSPFSAQVVAALSEAIGIAALAAVASWIAAIGFAAMCGAFAFVYYPLAAACLGCTPLTWCLKRDALVRIPRWRRHDAPPAAGRRKRLYLVKPAAEPERQAARTDSGADGSDSLLRRSAMR